MRSACLCWPRRVELAATTASAGPRLAELAAMTTLSIDTGDVKVVEEWAATGIITDATTNPLFVSQAGLSGDAFYKGLVDEAVAYAREAGVAGEDGVALAADRLAVNLGLTLQRLVPGYVSTEVSIYLSFDADAMVERARRIVAMYKQAGGEPGRVLIKLPGTWEGIEAARVLEAEGTKTNITLVFGHCQAVAAAQAGAHLISPFPGRVLEWHKANGSRPETMPREDDPGVQMCSRAYRYYKRYGHDTIVMPASWRSPTGADNCDEILALAGTDRMTIPPPLLEDLAARGGDAPLARELEPQAAAAACDEPEHAPYTRETFAWELAMDGAANDKLAAGLRAFAGDTDKLFDALREHPDW